MTWIGKHIPISVCIFSNLINEPLFPCKPGLHYLVASFIGVAEGLASQSKAQRRTIFFDIETTITIRLGSIQENLNQCQRQDRTIEAKVIQDECGDEKCSPIQFLPTQKLR